MTAPAISIRNLGKRYLVNHAVERERYRTLRDSVARAATAPLRRLSGKINGESEEFWALKNVEFDVQPGEVVGIIGRNGAGKSTLLKILSRITRPTTGHVGINGRVASLLEVGTGFHPELTGRENIFMNGSILGMSRRDIQRCFDAIVAFADVEKFLDTPIKRYSSGMYVRLAFAVAAHLEPEILIVDEVLAVGDVAFQRKCLRRIRTVSETGRTVLFVSHNMAALESLCKTGVLLDKGSVSLIAPISDTVSEYSRRVLSGQRTADQFSARRPVNGRCSLFRSAALIDESHVETQLIKLGSSLRVRMTVEATDPIEFPLIGVAFNDALDQRLLTVHTPVNEKAIRRLEGVCHVDCLIDRLPLAPGDYSIKLALSANGAELDSVDRAIYFTVVDRDAFGDGRGHHRGICIAPASWSVCAES